MKSIDKYSLAIGVLLSLSAQGLYDVVFYGMQSKTPEEWAAVAATIVSSSILFLVLYYQGYLKPRPSNHK